MVLTQTFYIYFIRVLVNFKLEVQQTFLFYSE